jgi:glycogen debranching enzyme
MDERHPPTDTFPIVADRAPADERTFVLKHDETFAIFDHVGDVLPVGLGEQGLYHEGTRFLSTYTFTLGRQRPLFLGSMVTEDNVRLTVDLANPDIACADADILPRDSVHIARDRFLWRGGLYERITLRNHGMCPASLAFTIACGADFADIFEVRGTRRARRQGAGGERRWPPPGLRGARRRRAADPARLHAGAAPRHGLGAAHRGGPGAG